MKYIKIKKDEFDYLINSTFLSNKIKSKITEEVIKTNQYYMIRVPESILEEIRDKCGEQLQISGFDEHYNPNEEGKILESLIDKLFQG